MQWSAHQEAFIEHGRQLPASGSAVVEAVAGSGKTSSLVAAMEAATGVAEPQLAAAFGVSTAEEWKQRYSGPADVRTAHSLALRACNLIGRDLGFRFDLDRTGKRARELARASCLNLVTTPKPDLVAAVMRAAAWAKNTLRYSNETLLEDAKDHLADMAIGTRPPELTSERLASAVAATIRAAAADTRTLDFDDLLWLPNLYDWRCALFDVVWADEVQDYNAAQIALAGRVLAPGGQFVAVGDSRQSIYGFRGASSTAMADIRASFPGTSLPLSVTYRCPRVVVAHVRKYAPQIEAAPGAADGTLAVRRIQTAEGVRSLLAELRPGDFVLSRTNAPLLWLRVRLGSRARVLGRNPTARLRALLASSGATSVRALRTWLAAQVDTDEDVSSELTDALETLSVVAETETSIQSIQRRLQEIDHADAASTGPCIRLSTVHQAKGLEAETVYLLEDTFFLRRGDPREEQNLYYVAATRARSTLVRVWGAPWRTQAGADAAPRAAEAGAPRAEDQEEAPRVE